jgi:hypothetical protein
MSAASPLPPHFGHDGAWLRQSKRAVRRRRTQLLDHLIRGRQKAWANAIPSAFAAIEIDDDPKPHVQQRSPGVIFRFEALGWFTGLLRALANWGNVLAVQTRIGSNAFLGRNAHGNN